MRNTILHEDWLQVVRGRQHGARSSITTNAEVARMTVLRLKIHPHVAALLKAEIEENLYASKRSINRAGSQLLFTTAR